MLQQDFTWGFRNHLQSRELHLSKASTFLVLVMTLESLSGATRAPERKDVFYSNARSTMVCRDISKRLPQKLSLSLSHHQLPRFLGGHFPCPSLEDCSGLWPAVTFLVLRPHRPLSTAFLSDHGSRGAARAWTQHLAEVRIWTMKKHLMNSVHEEKGGCRRPVMDHPSCELSSGSLFQYKRPTAQKLNSYLPSPCSIQGLAVRLKSQSNTPIQFLRIFFATLNCSQLQTISAGRNFPNTCFLTQVESSVLGYFSNHRPAI